MVAAFITCALGLIGSMAANTVQVDAAWWPPMVWIVCGLLIVAAIAVGTTRSRTEPVITTQGALDRITDLLAQAVQNQWRLEEERRKVADPVALPIRWHPADGALVDHWANIRRLPAGSTVGPLPLAGRFEQVADVYRRIPSGRLVILGGGGAGKTVLAARLVLDLLATRTSDDPVPVIVSVGSWDPLSPLRDWLATQLVRDYPALSRVESGSILALALLTSNRILPILDGFDEINLDLHQDALKQLNNAAGLPLVLTSRPDEYTAAIHAAGVLSNAAGIVIDDLALSDLGGYLPRTIRHSVSDRRTGPWNPVLDRLRHNPNDPGVVVLRKVLTTPLMVYLARTIYSDTPDGDPAELLEHERFPNPEAGASFGELVGCI